MRIPPSISRLPDARALRWLTRLGRLIPGWLVLGLTLLPGLPARAAQDPAAAHQAVLQFLQVQTQNLPGRVELTLTPLAANNKLVACRSSLQPSLGAGARLWGRSSVLLRCLDEGGWQIYVPVEVRVYAHYLVAARNLSRDQSLEAADLVEREGELTSLPEGLLLSSDHAIGRQMTRPLAIGQALTTSMLREAAAVQQGQNVKVISTGPGFQVSGAAGRAMNNASDGQITQVRMANGHVVSGIARPGGIVEVVY